jgi:hypothetical protein
VVVVYLLVLLLRVVYFVELLLERSGFVELAVVLLVLSVVYRDCCVPDILLLDELEVPAAVIAERLAMVPELPEDLVAVTFFRSVARPEARVVPRVFFGSVTVCEPLEARPDLGPLSLEITLVTFFST